MPQAPINAAERVAVARTVLEMIQAYAAAYAPGAPISDVTTDVLIGCAIFIGQAEGRPVTAGDVSNMTGIARTTVSRRVQACIERGKLKTRKSGRRIELISISINEPALLQALERSTSKAVKRFAKLAQLPKPDTF